MANKGAILQGLVEKVVFKAIARLTYDATGNLRVTTTPTGTHTVAGTLTTSGTVAPVGSTVAASSQAISQQIMQQSFRRNLVVT